jgi:hypothetical protein
VQPTAFDKQGAAGFLFVIRGGLGYVYSRDAQHVARAEFPLLEVEGEGAFIYPSAFIGQFSSFTDDEITFEVKNDPEGYAVKYTTRSGAADDRPSFAPEHIETCDRELSNAKDERKFSVVVLKEAIAQSRDFENKDSRADEKHKTIQIFDKDFEVDDPKNHGQKIRPCERGDGTLFTTNGTQAFYFYTDAFAGKSMAVHAAHLSMLQAFLSKATGEVILKTGGNKTYAVDGAGRVFGWVHSNPANLHQKYVYYGLSNDTHVLEMDKTSIVRALNHVEKLLDDNRTKIRITLDAAESTLQFHVVEGSGRGHSWPVPVAFKDGTKERTPFVLNVNVKHLTDIIKGCKSNQIVLRVNYLPAGEARPKDQGMFRTIDEFVLDSNGKVVGGSDVVKVPEGAAVCRVTRFTPSMT